MKRIFSLLLALTMLVSTLAILSSCGGDDTPDPEIPAVRYTVTEEEWIANMQSINYTVNGKYINTDKFIFDNITSYSYGSIEMQMTDNAVMILSEQQMNGDHEIRKSFQIVNDDGCFKLFKNLYTGVYEATEAYEYEWRFVSEIIFMYGFDVYLEGGYSSFTYDEANKCYAFTYTYTDSYNDIVETQTHTISIEFVDGKISFMKIEKIREQEDDGYLGTCVYEFSFTNVGTTKIDIPAYTVVE